jgi:hypothetical protein
MMDESKNSASFDPSGGDPSGGDPSGGTGSGSNRPPPPFSDLSPPPSSGSNLFLKLCLIIGGLAMAGSCVALLSPMGRQMARSTFDLMASVGGASAAPGTDALRAIGCDTALVMPFEAVLDPLADFSDALGEPEDAANASENLGGIVLVQCMPNLLRDEALTCEEIAATYGAATEATEEFVVMLERANVLVCAGFYSPDGTMTRPIDDFEEVPSDAL